jgi:hypothetical protein
LGAALSEAQALKTFWVPQHPAPLLGQGDDQQFPEGFKVL